MWKHKNMKVFAQIKAQIADQRFAHKRAALWAQTKSARVQQNVESYSRGRRGSPAKGVGL